MTAESAMTAEGDGLAESQRGWAKRALGIEALRAEREWLLSGRPDQAPLFGLQATWLVLGGRGAGKTRLGAEWVNALARGLPPFAGHRHRVIAMVGETLTDVREVMVAGPAGVLASARGERPRHEKTRRRLVWPNGAVAQLFSAEDPDSLRGPQFEAAWLDELAKWRHAERCFDMLQFALRLGARPLQLITTTPRPLPLVRRLAGDEAVTVTRLRTEDNAENLAAGFVAALRRRYGGSALGRQELEGELIDEREGALWTRAMIEAAANLPAAPLTRIVVAVDPPAAASRRSSACGLVAAGVDQRGRAVILEDATMTRARPADWAAAALALYERHQADGMVVEVNQGGDMATQTIRTLNPLAPIKAVRATRGKWLRAEPVAALYAQGRVRHAGRFAELEDEMCDFTADGLSSRRSPDRLDALVWAVTDLLLKPGGEPRVRLG